MIINENIIDTLPIDIKKSIMDIEKSKKEYDKDPDNILLRIDLKQSLADLSLSCKWHRVEGDVEKDFLDDLEKYYWEYLK